MRGEEGGIGMNMSGGEKILMFKFSLWPHPPAQ